MTDLKRAFLERELSDQEFKALEAELSRSPEAALRFSEMAAKDYASFGMPQPKLPGKAWMGGAGMKLAIAGLAGSALLGWVLTTSPNPPEAPPAPLALSTVERERGHVSQKGERVRLQAKGPSAPQQAQPSIPSLAERVQVWEFTGSDQRRHIGLALEVMQEGAWSLEVQDAQGRSLRRLQQGEPSKGKVLFDFDGGDGAGQVLKAGRYRLNLKGPEGDWSGWVELETF